MLCGMLSAASPRRICSNARTFLQGHCLHDNFGCLSCTSNHSALCTSTFELYLKAAAELGLEVQRQRKGANPASPMQPSVPRPRRSAGTAVPGPCKKCCTLHGQQGRREQTVSANVWVCKRRVNQHNPASIPLSLLVAFSYAEAWSAVSSLTSAVRWNCGQQQPKAVWPEQGPARWAELHRAGLPVHAEHMSAHENWLSWTWPSAPPTSTPALSRQTPMDSGASMASDTECH